MSWWRRLLGWREAPVVARGGRRPPVYRSLVPDEFELFTTVFGLAAEGRLVQDGGFTQFSGQGGFLGQKGTHGIAYFPAEQMEGVNYPSPPLSASLLTAEEVEVVAGIGTYRVLALLGQRHRHYPCPPWSERGRPSVLTLADFEQSLLSKVPVAHFRHARALLQSDKLALRIDGRALSDLRELLAPLPPEAAFALLTAADGQANARLVYRPGQGGPEAIAPPDSAGSRVTGGFVAVVPSPDRQGGEAFEDGFVVWGSAEVLGGLREAMREGRSFALAGKGGCHNVELRLDGGAKGPGRVQLVQGVLYQPDPMLQRRVVDRQEFTSFVGEMGAAVTRHVEGVPEGPGQALTLVVAIRPGRRARFWLEFAPGGEVAELEAGLQRALGELRAPAVREGPVAYAWHVLLWGGPGASGPSFAFLPRAWAEACAGEEGIVPDAPLDRLWPG